MNLKKIILCLLILFIFSGLYPSELFELVSIRMQDGSKRTSQILCIGKSGLIVWNSRLPYEAELINVHAEYISFKKIKKIQADNYMSIIPLTIGFFTGVVLVASQFINKPEDAEDAFYRGFGAIFLFGLSVAVGAFGTALSVVMPRRYNANEFETKRIASKGRIIFRNNFPPEIAKMLAKYEKDNSKPQTNVSSVWSRNAFGLKRSYFTVQEALGKKVQK